MTVTHGERWRVYRRAARDRTGDAAFTPAGYVDDCAYSVQDTIEMVDGRETVVTTSRLSMPKDAAVSSTDRVESPSGQMFRVDGLPRGESVNPFTGWDSGRKVFTIKAVS